MSKTGGQNDSREQAVGDDGAASQGSSGRISVDHHDGTRFEVGEPVLISGDTSEKPWICIGKLVGRKGQVVSRDEDDEYTSTLLVRTGRGRTAAEAQKDAMNQLSVVFGPPKGAAPTVRIVKKPSEPPPAVEPSGSWWQRMVRKWFGRNGG